VRATLLDVRSTCNQCEVHVCACAAVPVQMKQGLCRAHTHIQWSNRAAHSS
jgi:hypothetical protein